MPTWLNTLENAPAQALPHRRFRREFAPRRSKTGLPLGLLGMAVLVLATETFISRYPLRFLDPPTFSWTVSARRATHEALQAETLCLGDSLVKHGLIPSVISKTTGEITENASAASAPSAWTYFVFRRALEAGAKPRAVVFDLKPGVLVGGPRHDLKRFQENLTARECSEVYRASGSQSIGASLLFGRLPSVRNRLEIRSAILAAFQGKLSRIELLNEVCARNWSVNGGANVARKHPEFHGDVTEDEHKKLVSDRFAPHRVNAWFARKIVELARSERIASYLVIAPISPEMQARRTSSGADAKYDAFVRSLQELDPSLTVVDARDGEYLASVFVDATHLDRDGAIALSDDLAAILQRDRLAAVHEEKRWIKLPKYRQRPFDPSLEDIDGSRRVLKIEFD